MTNLVDCGCRYYEVPSNEPDPDDDLCYCDDEPNDDSDFVPYEERKVIWTEF